MKWNERMNEWMNKRNERTCYETKWNGMKQNETEWNEMKNEWANDWANEWMTRQ